MTTTIVSTSTSIAKSPWPTPPSRRTREKKGWRGRKTPTNSLSSSARKGSVACSMAT